ncbi:MAG TPA: hypothetical protein VG867_02965 [Rhizomicrobium sp.]|nr:hypothetical protein [Rhizomicrobium sp.]
MLDFVLRWLWSTTMVQTFINKNIRNIAIAAGAAVAALAAHHGASHETSVDLQNEIAGLVITAGGWGWSLVDAWVVKRKIAAAAAGAPAPARPVDAAAAVGAADAAAPKSDAALIADLEKGGPQ